MSVIRDLRERIEGLEDRECTRWESDWPDAWRRTWFWCAMSFCFACAVYGFIEIAKIPNAPNPSVECVKIGGEWSWGVCHKAQK